MRGGILTIFVFGVAIREIHPDADVLFRRRDRDIPAKRAVNMRHRTPHRRRQGRKPICRDDLPQGRPLRKLC